MPKIIRALPNYSQLPNGWLLVERRLDGARYEHRDGLKVICSVAQETDGRHWLHVSLSRRNRMPSYAEMCEIKDIFIGLDKLAMQLFVPEDQHSNIHEFCLHLWHCLDGDPFPEFARQVEGLGKST